jgi:hypothetical protein
MDWFEKITGFAEKSYAETQAALSVVGGRLHAHGRDRGVVVGTLTLPSLAELRGEAAAVAGSGRLRLSIAEGDVRAMHRAPENRGALFQVASQFNMLEMVGPDVTPERGVTDYVYDRTQGPACAVAAGGGTIVRNYLVPVTGAIGQTRERQLDGSADLRAALAQSLGGEAPWSMRNGYALPTEESLATVTRDLSAADESTLDGLRGLLRVGLHRDIEVTDGARPGPLVSQIFCSAMPVSYSGLPRSSWAPLARLVLEAAYEATLLAAVLNAARGASRRLLLTRLGGGAFGNDDGWINSAMLRALRLAGGHDLDVRIVSYGRPLVTLVEFVRQSGFVTAE